MRGSLLPLVLNDAPSQRDRAGGPDPADRAPVDARSLADLLEFAARFAALVNFYDLDDRPQGDWVEFFLCDPTIALSAVAAFDAARRAEEVRALALETVGARGLARKRTLLRSAFAAAQSYGRALDGWLRGFRDAPPSSSTRLLGQALEEAIDGGLAAELRRLLAWDRGAAEPDALGAAIGLDWSGFAPRWGLAGVTPDGSIYRGANRGRRVDAALPHLERVAAAFAARIPELAAAAAAQIPGTLETADHPPQSALFVAFARLFAHAQRSANTVAPRYRDFYYRRVLREPAQGALADSVDLTFALADEEGVRSATVPAGTLFPAGEDPDGREVLYAAERALAVSRASLERQLTLRVLRGPLVVDPPVSGAPLPVVPQRVRAAEVAPSGTGPWPLFGVDAASPSGAPARLGFAVASWCLLLTSGRRHVALTVRYPEAFRDEVLRPLLDAAAAATGLAPDAVRRTVLGDAFRLRASTAAGWFPVEGYRVEIAPPTPAPTHSWFRLCFELPPSAPPLEPIAEESDAGDPPATLPTVAVELRADPAALPGGGALFAYSLLARMPVDGVRVDATVSGLGGLAIENTDGPVDPSVPFALFGGTPSVGSYLRVRQRELFVKTPDTLRLALDWYALPPNQDGFTGWYRDYTLGLDGRPPASPPLFDDATFAASLAVRDAGAWTIAPSGAPVDQPIGFVLFEARKPEGTCGPADAAPNGPLCPATRLDDLVVRTTGGAGPYYDPAESALEIRLTAPAYAFGADLYPINVLNSVLEDLPDTEGCQEKCLAACAVLTAAADDAAAALAHCEDEQDPAYLACIAPRLATLLRQLVASCVQEVLACLGPAGSALAEDLEAAAAVPQAAEHGPRLRRIADAARATMLARSAKSSVCLDRCLALLDAAVAVALAETCPDKVCVTSIVGEAVQQLRQAYDACLEACMADCMAVTPPLRYPNEPFLPQLTGLQVHYSAHAELPGDGVYFHLQPFGGFSVASPPQTLLPPLPGEGSLYLGFAGLAPPQPLTLLFEMAQTGGAGAAPLPRVDWSYLSADGWHALPEASVGPDSTHGLEATGILGLALPSYVPTAGTVLPGDRRWLRAAVGERPEAFPEALAIVPHALRVTRQVATGDPLAPLPAHTISSSVQDLPAIGSVDQPLPSFGGRPREDDAGYERRLGERLRHKQRAVLGWDYERLVLERFPSIWKARVLPAGSVPGAAPGSVTVVVVPGPSSETAVDLTVPLASREVLGAVEDYLRPLVGGFVRVRVVNPLYVRTQVRAWVAFVAGEDEGACLRRLDAELVRYLSPWYDGPERASRDGLYASEDDVSSFIQSRPYVETLDRLRFRYRPRRTSVPWCFLTSAESHEIHAVVDGDAR
jgi:hypothetical protein